MLEVQPQTLEEARALVRSLRIRLSIIELQFSLQKLYPLDVKARHMTGERRRIMQVCFMRIEGRRREQRSAKYADLQVQLTEALEARARLGALAQEGA